MNQPTAASKHEAGGHPQGATVVITHRVQPGKHEAYEAWLEEIVPVGRQFPGHLHWQIIRPVPGLTGTYTVIIRFDSRAHLQNWMTSPQRKALIEKARPLLEKGDDFFISTGLDFWFIPEGAPARTPVRWKQFLVTWSAIYPLVILVPLALMPVLRWLGLAGQPYLVTAVVTGVTVFLMAYVVMPHYTRLIKRWLFA